MTSVESGALSQFPYQARILDKWWGNRDAFTADYWPQTRSSTRGVARMIGLRDGARLTAVGVVGTLACTTLMACENDENTAGGNGAAASSPGAREEGTAADRTAFDKTAAVDTARLTLRSKASVGGKTLTVEGQGVIDLPHRRP
ncbi:hypothetical protein [Streptomyces sp. NPDC048641]|uniref:hypothetical protein n=1 Tax=Streptomyces sp. NPDC048641 TaxID=3154825 RepID=UPI003431CA77